MTADFVSLRLKHKLHRENLDVRMVSFAGEMPELRR